MTKRPTDFDLRFEEEQREVCNPTRPNPGNCSKCITPYVLNKQCKAHCEEQVGPILYNSLSAMIKHGMAQHFSIIKNQRYFKIDKATIDPITRNIYFNDSYELCITPTHSMDFQGQCLRKGYLSLGFKNNSNMYCMQHFNAELEKMCSPDSDADCDSCLFNDGNMCSAICSPFRISNVAKWIKKAELKGIMRPIFIRHNNSKLLVLPTREGSKLRLTSAGGESLLVTKANSDQFGIYCKRTGKYTTLGKQYCKSHYFPHVPNYVLSKTTLSTENFSFTYNFQDVSFIWRTSFEDDEFTLELDEDCTTITFNKEKNIMKMSSLFFDHPVTFCTFYNPSKQWGSIVINMVVQMGKYVGVDYITLEDASTKITCGSTIIQNFPMYRVLTTGNTWYGKFGFIPYDIQFNLQDDREKIDNNALQIYQDIEILLQTPYSDIMDDLVDLEGESEEIDNFRIYDVIGNSNLKTVMKTVDQAIKSGDQEICDSINDFINKLTRLPELNMDFYNMVLYI
jgi:hypothetical protein